MEAYNEIAAAQDHRCAACGTPEAECYHQRLYVDYDHETGEVRGLLCHRCRTALGMVNDSPARLRALEHYLEMCMVTPTKDQSWCEVGRCDRCTGFTEDESDPESCFCPCHDAH